MSGENTIEYKLYELEKSWLKNVESLLLDTIPLLKDLIKQTEKLGSIEYNDGENKAYVKDSTLTLTSQNFKFTIIDDEHCFSIKYEILDKYTKKNVEKMLGVENKGEFLYISKIIQADPHFYVKWGNYPCFISFIREIESLKCELEDVGE